jgi:hypothetical protein
MDNRYTHGLLKGLLISSAMGFSCMAEAVLINEIRIDQTGADDDEHFELAGAPGESLDGLSYLVIGDAGTNSGIVESVTSLSGFTIGSSGYFLIAESNFGLGGMVDHTATINFENNDNVTHLLVTNFTGSKNDDLDIGDNGALDTTPWQDILDSIALIKIFGSGDQVYSTTQIGPASSSAPAHVFRDGHGLWQIGAMDLGNYDTPGSTNTSLSVSEPGSTILMGLGLVALAVSRRRRKMVARSTEFEGINNKDGPGFMVLRPAN